jgi:starch phosphorylase
VEQRRQAGELEMGGVIAASPRLEEALEAIRSGLFSADDRSRYEGLVDGLVHDDRFMLCADFEAYWHAQCRVEEVWREPDRWWRSALLNVARIGWFSADRTISEYARDIWKL